MPDCRFVLVKGCAGLGNRLLTVASAMHFAAATNRTIAVDWGDGVYAAAGEEAFASVYDIRPPFVDLASVLEAATSVYPPVWARDRLGAPIYEVCKPCKSPLHGFASHFLPRGRARMVSRHWHYYGAPSSREPMPMLAFLRSALSRSSFPYGADLSRGLAHSVVVFSDFLPPPRHSELHAFPPLKPHLRHMIEALRRTAVRNTESEYTGVHVRATDLAPARGVERLVQLLTAREPGTRRFYVATDNPEVIEFLKKSLPGRIIHQDVEWPDDFRSGLHHARSLDGAHKRRHLEEALVDLHMLGACHTLYAQSNSSFSSIARTWHNDPAREVLWDVI